MSRKRAVHKNEAFVVAESQTLKAWWTASLAVLFMFL